MSLQKQDKFSLAPEFEMTVHNINGQKEYRLTMGNGIEIAYFGNHDPEEIRMMILEKALIYMRALKNPMTKYDPTDYIGNDKDNSDNTTHS